MCLGRIEEGDRPKGRRCRMPLKDLYAVRREEGVGRSFLYELLAEMYYMKPQEDARTWQGAHGLSESGAWGRFRLHISDFLPSS